jgi:hypothetical protein
VSDGRAGLMISTQEELNAVKENAARNTQQGTRSKEHAS